MHYTTRHPQANSSFSGSTDSINKVGTTSCDVVVIGGGLAGLSAAYWLTKKTKDSEWPIKIVVAEASDHVGGRILSVPMKSIDGRDWFDIGAQWIGSDQRDFLELVKDLGLDLYSQYGEGNRKVQLGSSTVRTLGPGKLAYWGIDSMDMKVAARKLQSIVRQTPAKDPFKSDEAEYYDGITLEQLVVKLSMKQYTRDYFENLCLSLFGVHANQVSALYFAAVLESFGGLDKMFGARLKIHGGAQQICQLLAEKIDPGNIFLAKPIQVVLQHHDGVTVLAKTGYKFEAKYAIVAIPPQQVAQIQFEPQLPYAKRQFLASCATGPQITFLVTFKTPFWRLDKLSGQVIASGLRNEGQKPRPVIFVADATSGYLNAALFGIISPDWYLTPLAERRKQVLKDLFSFFGKPTGEYLEYAEKHWADDRWIGGVSSHVSTGGMEAYITGKKMPFGRIYWAGTETATKWIGNMAGAAQSGRRSAYEILSELNKEGTTKLPMDPIPSIRLSESVLVGSVDDENVSPLIPCRSYRSSFRLRRSGSIRNRYKLQEPTVDDLALNGKLNGEGIVHYSPKGRGHFSKEGYPEDDEEHESPLLRSQSHPDLRTGEPLRRSLYTPKAKNAKIRPVHQKSDTQPKDAKGITSRNGNSLVSRLNYQLITEKWSQPDDGQPKELIDAASVVTNGNIEREPPCGAEKNSTETIANPTIVSNAENTKSSSEAVVPHWLVENATTIDRDMEETTPKTHVSAVDNSQSHNSFYESALDTPQSSNSIYESATEAKRSSTPKYGSLSSLKEESESFEIKHSSGIHIITKKIYYC